MNYIWSPDYFRKAFVFAANAHQGQVFPGTELPYLTHVTLVCTELMAALADGMDGDLAIQCAALHDVLEDTPTSHEVIEQEFGKQVAAGVASLTKNSVLPKELQMEDSLQRIVEQPREVWMVKMADRIVNLNRPPAHWSSDKISKYKIEASNIHDTLKAANYALADRLCTKIENYPL